MLVSTVRGFVCLVVVPTRLGFASTFDSDPAPLQEAAHKLYLRLLGGYDGAR